jgi:SAM-dependent methyltransferase
MQGSLLDVGCGKMPYREHIIQNSEIKKYIGLDIETHLDYGIKPDITWDTKHIPFSDSHFNTVLLTEVLEHSSEPENLLQEICRIMDKDGYLMATVPFIWNLHEVPHDEYRYTPFALQRMLEKSGFKNIEIVAHGNWDASLAQMLGLWVCRRKMKKIYKNILSFILKPIIAKLLKLDARPTVNKTSFQNEFMPTGFYFTCQKK